MSIFDKIKKKEDAKDVAVSAKSTAQDNDLTLEQLKEEEAKKKDAKAVKKATAKATDTGMAYKWLVKPLITEKATYLGSFNKYIFEVANNANKIEIKKALKSLYGVDAVKINIINTKGKNVRFGKVTGKTKAKKKAVITLKQGQSIELYEGV